MDNQKKELLMALLNRHEPKVISSPVTATINSEYKDDSGKTTKLTEEKVELERKYFGENPVRLWVDYSHTIPMRPYESAKVSVGLSIPIGIELPESYIKDIHAAHEFATKFIEEKIQKEVASINDFLKAKNVQSSGRV
jgi:hypothetical protein